jgi:hypothetical protein
VSNENKARISNKGSQRKNITVRYHGPLKTNAVRIALLVNSFTLNKYAGNTELFLTSALLLTEVYGVCPCLREGSKTPCFLVTLCRL